VVLYRVSFSCHVCTMHLRGGPEYHQKILENLRDAIKNTKKLCVVNLPHVYCYFTCLCDIHVYVYDDL
jgi:hypothetical protein